MNDLPKEFIASSCEGKQRHNRHTARMIAKRMNAKGKNQQAYKCCVCKGWHVGTRDKDRKV